MNFKQSFIAPNPEFTRRNFFVFSDKAGRETGDILVFGCRPYNHIKSRTEGNISHLQPVYTTGWRPANDSVQGFWHTKKYRKGAGRDVTME